MKLRELLPKMDAKYYTDEMMSRDINDGDWDYSDAFVTTQDCGMERYAEAVMFIFKLDGKLKGFYLYEHEGLGYLEGCHSSSKALSWDTNVGIFDVKSEKITRYYEVD